MAVITFIKDVTISTEPEGTGPHYRAGYCVDASPDFACAQVAEGNAVHGVVETKEPVIVDHDESVIIADEDLPPMPPKRKTRWKP